jgi:predicted dehydrogenase
MAATRRLRRLDGHLLLQLRHPRTPSGTTTTTPSTAAVAAAIEVGILTEATGEHLDGFLGGFALADGVSSVSAADNSSAGATTFGTVRAALPAGRVGSMHTSAVEMLHQRRPTLTLVTAEAHRTPPLVRAALESGSHVLVEKPGCLHLSEFESLCDLADHLGLQVMLAMATRLNPAIVRAKQLIGQGFLGEPFSATMDWVRIEHPVPT